MSTKVHLHMHVSDLGKSRDFYERFLGAAYTLAVPILVTLTDRVDARVVYPVPPQSDSSALARTRAPPPWS